MGDCVSREWLLRHLFFETDRELVRRAPDAEPVRHGMWVFGELGVFGSPVKCSECGWGEKAVGFGWVKYEGNKYCGHCGAKMEGWVEPDD